MLEFSRSIEPLPGKPAAPGEISLYLHGILSAQGGAARVMGLLAQGAERHGFKTFMSCEFKDSGAEKAREIAPLNLGGHVPPVALSHVHGSRNWDDLFRGFSVLGQRVDFITMHDCALLTGGCIHPGDCPGWSEGCTDDCPQAYKDVVNRQNALRSVLRAQAPTLVCPSAWLRRMARAVFPGIDCVLIPNGVEDPLLSADRASARQALGLVPGAKLLLFAAHGGKLAPAKGVADFLAVWRAVKAKLPEAAAFIVGGDEVSREGDLYYWPYVDTAHMQRFMLAADMFVSASPAENHSLVILEAMAAGVPVCAYKTGGVPEQVIDNETGVLAPVGDVAALAAAAQALLGNAATLRRMGLKARLRYERNFQAKHMVADYMKLYFKALK